MNEEDYSLCMSCICYVTCATMSGEEPVAFECEGYMPKDE